MSEESIKTPEESIKTPEGLWNDFILSVNKAKSSWEELKIATMDSNKLMDLDLELQRYIYTVVQVSQFRFAIDTLLGECGIYYDFEQMLINKKEEKKDA